MKPLKLTMQAFGPYASTEVIDFTELGNRTMFVISGKTGAGKTTIFDGLCFAIYGRASGEDRGGPELRSHFAQDELLTEVSLEFYLREKHYYIYRSPQQEKKKKKGEGTTTAVAKAELYEIIDGQKELLGANVTEVNEQIKKIIGLDANQFRQILMIPQGEFRKLLISESREKEQILQKLFHTENYKQVEEKLKEEAFLLKKQSEKGSQIKAQLMREIIARKTPELQAELEVEKPNEHNVFPLLSKEIADTDIEMTQLHEQIVEKQKVRDSIQQEITKAEQLSEQFNEKARLQLKKESLAAEKQRMAVLQEQVKKAEKAKALQIQEQFYLRIGQQLQAVNEEIDRLNLEWTKLKDTRMELEEQFQREVANEEIRSNVLRELHQLEQLKDAVLSFSELQAEVERKKQEWDHAATKKNQLESEFHRLTEEIEKIEVKKTEAEQAAVLYITKDREAEKSMEMLNKLQQLRANKREFAEETSRYFEAEKQLFAQNKRVAEAKTKLHLLEQQWFNSQAAMLAVNLKDQCPCPVCGATEHPAPASLSENMVTEAALKQEKQNVAEEEERKKEKETVFFQFQSRVSMLEQNLKTQVEAIKEVEESFELDQLDSLKREYATKSQKLNSELPELASKKNQLSALTEQLAEKRKKVNQLQQGMELVKKECEAVHLQYIELRAKLNELAHSLPEEIRTVSAYKKTVATLRTKHEQLQAAFERAKVALQEVQNKETVLIGTMDNLHNNQQKLKEELDVEREKFVQEMKSQGFENYKEFKEAKKTEEERNKIEETIQLFEQEWQSVVSLFHDIELKLKGLEKPDLLGLQNTFTVIDADLEQVRDKLNERKLEQQKNKEILQKLESLNLEQVEIEEKYRIVGHLYEITKGQNPFKITFERYVLAAFLDDILSAANIRLLKMTSGRYQLLRKLDPTKRNVQSGLELTVFDQYTSQERHVKTLSGGESFKASLALALGLADVVQQHAGGISLETMFIDEGFGTLDPESLDQAVEVLMEIQSSGRLVGIISHVPELKERIDAQLEVVSTQKGSRTSFRFLN